ncbi:MAG TPA: AAA family ATPase [Blastocatellia bacterium]|nr:AAA family ATPase [Blastocatellia bacterium]HMZ17112.1 AAA family ATPase [Blastocatellia bacterium]HNG33727.1 AAA family ATPase [Blastocatellia bacterium]
MSSTPQLGSSSASALRFPPFHIPANVDLLYREEKIVALERRAVQVLRYLVEHHDRVVSKDELLEAVWPDTYITDGVLKRAVSQARRALGDVADESRFIETYHGRGYRFIAEVLAQNEPPAEVKETRLLTLPPAEVKATRPLTLPPALQATIDAKPVSETPDYNQLAGRQTEMAQLQGDYRRALAGTGHTVLMIGDPGVGKTQLAREFANWARAEGAVCLYTQFFDYQASRLAPYEVFLDLLRNILGVTAVNREDCDLRVLARNHFNVNLPEELFIDARVTGQLRLSGTTGTLRLDDLPPRKTGPLSLQRTTGALATPISRPVTPISQCLIRASRQRPLVLILDDIQWADETSREVIGHLMRTVQSEPLMLLCLARAEALNDRESKFAEWLKRLAGYRSYTTLTLNPLDESACVAAIEAIFGNQIIVPPADFKRLHAITGGNPYFLVEMLRLLVAEKAIQFDAKANPAWQWRGIKDLSLPVTVVMAAQAKLDRLSSEVREIAECAAVIGDEFRIETLAVMTGINEDDIERLVMEGARRGVLAERGVSADNDARFHHNTLRQVLYDSLPPRRRKRLHSQAAQAIESLCQFEPDRIAEALSAHYEAANLWEKAFDWSMRAWQAAGSRLSWSEAMICVERAARAAAALEQGSGNQLPPAERLNLLLAFGETHFALGNLKESDAAYGEAATLARGLNDRSALATALLQQGQTRMSLSLYQESAAVTEQALELYRATNDQEGAALALLQLGGIQVRQGNYEAAIALAQQALEGVALNSQVAAIAFGLLGWARALQGHYTEGVPLLERAIEYLSSVGDVQRRALLLRRSHWAELSRGNYEAAIELAIRARDDAHRLGDVTSEAKMEIGIGQARIAQGLCAEAIEILNRAKERLRAAGNTNGEAECLWLLGRAHCESGQLAEARKLLEKASGLILEVGDRDDEFRVLTDSARLALAEGDGQTALQLAEKAARIAEELGNRDGLGTALVEQARAFQMLNHNKDALAAIERARTMLEEAPSGEFWRACWAKAQILTISNPEAALEAFDRTMILLDEIRRQLSQDETRLALATKARRLPAQQFHALLLQQEQPAQARKIAESWQL